MPTFPLSNLSELIPRISAEAEPFTANLFGNFYSLGWRGLMLVQDFTAAFEYLWGASGEDGDMLFTEVLGRRHRT